MPKRVLFARSVDHSNINSAAKNIQSILRYWSATEVRPSAISFYEPDPYVAANPNVDIIRISPTRLWRHELFATYFRAFDAVFCPGLHHYADWAALRLRNSLRRPLPVINTLEGLIGVEADEAADRRFSDLAGHQVFSQKISRSHWCREEYLHSTAFRLIAISPFLGRMAGAMYGDKVSVLPLGVDIDLFRSHGHSRRERLRVVCAANVRAHKRPDVFVRLAKKFQQADFIWYGDGELRAPFLAEIEREGISNLSFPGALPAGELAEQFAMADIMVLPSCNEGVPKVTQEAAAAGLAQVILGFYEAPTVMDGVNGFVVWNEEQIAERLSFLLSDDTMRERMGRAGARMAQSWSWDLVAPQWEAAIVQAVKGLS